MRVARWSLAALLVLSSVGRGEAQVSCANPDNLCTGDPCTITTVTVQSPCVVDFGARTLVIAGIVDVPDGGTLSFTAATIDQRGPIDGRHVGGTGAAIALVATAGDVQVRGRIDVAGTVATGSIVVQATGDILVKDTLNAKPGGSSPTAAGGAITLDAGGTVVTDQSAALEAQGAGITGAGGTITLDGDLGVTAKGALRAQGNPGGTVDVESGGGSVLLANGVYVQSPGASAGSVVVNAATGVVVSEVISAAGGGGAGGTVTLLVNGVGDVTIADRIRARGVSGGTIDIGTATGTVTATGVVDASSTTGAGGAISIGAATVVLHRDVDVRSRNASGGAILLAASTLLDLRGGDAEAAGRINGGAIALYGIPAGNVTVRSSSALTAPGNNGVGGQVLVSAPAGAIDIDATVTVDGDTLGGTIDVDASALTIVGSRFSAEADVGGTMRLLQTGTGLFRLTGTYEARDDGTIEALAPSGDLTASGSFRARFTGCIGLSAGGVLDVVGVNPDIAITPSCP